MADAHLGPCLTRCQGQHAGQLNHACNNRHFPVNLSGVYPYKEMDGQEAAVRLPSHSRDVTAMI